MTSLWPIWTGTAIWTWRRLPGGWATSSPGSKTRGTRWTRRSKPGNQHLIEGDLRETTAIRAADFDADGDWDLLATAAPEEIVSDQDASEAGDAVVVWYENNGQSGVRTLDEAPDRRSAPGRSRSAGRLWIWTATWT